MRASCVCQNTAVETRHHHLALAEPLFKLLPDPKRLVVFEGGHVPAFELVVTTLNAWLDETLGPVKRE